MPFVFIFLCRVGWVGFQIWLLGRLGSINFFFVRWIWDWHTHTFTWVFGGVSFSSFFSLGFYLLCFWFCDCINLLFLLGCNSFSYLFLFSFLVGSHCVRITIILVISCSGGIIWDISLSCFQVLMLWFKSWYVVRCICGDMAIWRFAKVETRYLGHDKLPGRQPHIDNKEKLFKSLLEFYSPVHPTCIFYRDTIVE